MRVRAVVVAIVAVVGAGTVWVPGARASSPPPSQPAVCTWGGTAAAPTGTFSITPGLTDVPSTAPSVFKATGVLSGDAGCKGTLTYDGQIDVGGTCTENTFEGRAKGVRGVRTFAGVGTGPLGPARLYDKDGNVVGSENANVNTVQNAPHFADCLTTGFTGGNFSSTIVLFDGSATDQTR